MRRLLLLAFGLLVLAPLAAAAPGQQRAVPNLQLRTQLTTAESWPSVLLLPSWQFPASGPGADCYAAHTTLGTLFPENGDPQIDYHETRPPFPDAPTAGGWLWHCYALGGSGLKYPDPSFCTNCNYSDDYLNGEGKVSGPANVTVYLLKELQAGAAYQVIAEASAFVKIPAVAKPGTPAGSPTAKPSTRKPKTRPGTSSRPQRTRAGKRFTFTARLSGQPVVGAERLFASYQGSQATAAGSFVVAPPVGDQADIVDATGNLLIAHQYSAFPAERYQLELRATSTSLTKTFSNGRVVRLTVTVASTSFSGCPVGKEGSLVISDLTTGDGFELDLCGVRLVWVDHKNAAVAVTIRPA